MKIRVEAPAEMYTKSWLEHTIRRYGGEVVADPDDPVDVTFASVCDVDDFPSLRRIRRETSGPLIVGGLQASSGNGLPLAWADAVVLGEGETFIATLCQKGLEAALNLTCVVTPDEPRRAAAPADFIDLENAPVVQTNVRGWYALASRGCPKHCNFCLTSWAVRYQTTSEARLRAIARMAQREKMSLTWITNDSTHLPNIGYRGNAQSTTVERYLEAPRDFASANTIRLGVEGISEERRRWLGKTCTNEQIGAAVRIAKQLKQNLQIFLIVGFPEDQDAWLQWLDEVLPEDTDMLPRIWLKFTYIGPKLLTPLGRLSIADLTPFGFDNAWRQAMARNRRVRYYRPRNPAKAAWRTVMERCLWKDADAIPPSPPSGDLDEFFRDVQRRGLWYTISPTPEDELPGDHVCMPNRKACAARAQRLLCSETGTYRAVLNPDEQDGEDDG